MTEPPPPALTRRGFLKTGALAAAAAPLLVRASRADAATTTKVLDFQTNADVAKAEAEGEVVYYGHDSEPGIAVLLDAFNTDVRPACAEARVALGAAENPIRALRESGYAGRMATERETQTELTR